MQEKQLYSLILTAVICHLNTMMYAIASYFHTSNKEILSTKFLKRCKELCLQHFNAESVICNIEYSGLFKERKHEIVSEIVSKNLLI